MKLRPLLIPRKAGARGYSHHGWLESRHTFSFGDYYDPQHMGFRSLRVINDDIVAPGGGFAEHPHRDMEIFSYVLSGELAHEDSLGNRRVLRPGDLQLMRAGSGIRHAEFNPSATDPVHFLQIWITPDRRGLAPAYYESPAAKKNVAGKTLMISADGRDGSATIAQDASVYRVVLPPDGKLRHELEPGRGLWLHAVKGTGIAGDIPLSPGDAVSADEAGEVEISALSGTFEAILFDLG